MFYGNQVEKVLRTLILKCCKTNKAFCTNVLVVA